MVSAGDIIIGIGLLLLTGLIVGSLGAVLYAETTADTYKIQEKITEKSRGIDQVLIWTQEHKFTLSETKEKHESCLRRSYNMANITVKVYPDWYKQSNNNKYYILENCFEGGSLNG